jgi:hypothetical protein
LAAQPVIHIVCSDRHRNGKTLLARVLIDYLMLDGHDPFVIDAGFPGGALRNYFPGRTALVDFAATPGQMKLFDTILASPGRDYVIDLPAAQTDNFFKASVDLGFFDEAARLGFRIVVLFVIDQRHESIKAARAVEAKARPDLLMFVGNHFIGSAVGGEEQGALVEIPALDPEIVATTSATRFSFRSFLLGDGQGLAAAQGTLLKTFLYEIMTGLRNIAPAVTLQALKI